MLLKKSVCYDQCVPWQNSVSLCPASFCTPRPNLPVSPGISWLPSFAFQYPMRRKWQPTPVFLPGESCGWRSLVGYSPRVAKSRTWLSDFPFTFTVWWKGHISGVVVLGDLVGLHRTVQLQLLQYCWLGHRLGVLWYWMVCPGNKQRSFCPFRDCIQVLHIGLFCRLWGLLHLF